MMMMEVVVEMEVVVAARVNRLPIGKDQCFRFNKPIRHLSFRDWSDLKRLLRPELVELTCRVHMRSELDHWLL